MTLSTRRTVLLGLAALALAGCAGVGLRADRREADFARRWPPTGPLLSVGGRRVHAHVEGSGPDLILIHGASGNTRDFTFDLTRRLAGRYRVIAFDRPGLGHSDDIGAVTTDPRAQAAHLRAAAAQLDVRRPIVLGHSYGAAVAMAWALADPRGTAAVVSLAGATHPWPGDLGGWYPFITSGVGRAVATPLITALAPLSQADAVIARIFAPQASPPGYADHVGPGLSVRRAAIQANAAQVGSLKPFLAAMAPDYRSLTLPIEIVHGDADRIVWASVHGRRLAAEVPSARLTLLPGVGHMPHHADPAAVVAAIDRAAARAGLR